MKKKHVMKNAIVWLSRERGKWGTETPYTLHVVIMTCIITASRGKYAGMLSPSSADWRVK